MKEKNLEIRLFIRENAGNVQILCVISYCPSNLILNCKRYWRQNLFSCYKFVTTSSNLRWRWKIFSCWHWSNSFRWTALDWNLSASIWKCCSMRCGINSLSAIPIWASNAFGAAWIVIVKNQKRTNICFKDFTFPRISISGWTLQCDEWKIFDSLKIHASNKKKT